MRRPPPSLGFSWTLNLNYKVLLGLTFFFSHIVSLKILSLSSCLFICTCISFSFFLSCCYTLLSLYQFCYFALPQHLAIVSLPCCLPHLDVAPYCRSALLLLQVPPCCCYELHLAIVASSTLLLLWIPPCYMLYPVVVTPPCCYCSTIVVVLPTFLPCCLSSFVVSLLALGTNGLTWNSHCCLAFLLFLCLVTTTCFLCLLS